MSSDFNPPDGSTNLACGCFVVLLLLSVTGYFMTEHNRGARPSSQPLCSAESFDLCRRVEAGEAPAKVFGTSNVEEIVLLLQFCKSCGSFPHIENDLIPAGERLREMMRDMRTKQAP